MIYVQSIIKVSDNSGARYAQCIRILNKKPKALATVGDVLIVTIKKITPNKKVKKGSIHKAVVVRTTNSIKRFDGSRIKFNKAAIVILHKNKLPLATRIFGPVLKELRQLKYLKIVSLSTVAI